MLPLFTAILALFVVSVRGQKSLEGLPGQIVSKLRDNRHEDSVDLLAELQETFEWANTQSEWSEFSFPVDQVVSGLPMIGDLQVHVEGLRFTRFDATKADDGAPIVERTETGYRLGLFNVALDLLGIQLTTSGFFGATHTGTLTMKLADCAIEIEMVDGQLIPTVFASVGDAEYTFSSPSIMTEIIMGPVLMFSEPIMTTTIESAFIAYLHQFWLPVDMEYYISVAADAYVDYTDNGGEWDLSVEELAADKVAGGKIAAKELAADKVAGGKIAAEELAADRVAGGKIAAEELAVEEIATNDDLAEKCVKAQANSMQFRYCRA